MKNELKDLALEVLAFLISGAVVIFLLVFTDMSKWPVIIIGVGTAMGVVYLLREKS